MLNHELLAIHKLSSYKLAFSFFKWYAFQATYFLLFEMIPTEMKNLKKVTCQLPVPTNQSQFNPPVEYQYFL